MSASGALESSTHSTNDTQKLGLVHDALTADEALVPAPRYYLVGPGSEEPVELPEMRDIPYVRPPMHEQTFVPQVF